MSARAPETGDLAARLASARAEVARLEREMAGATCAEAGCHRMEFIGCANAGCGESDCSCSVPVHQCSVCGDSDYGDNREADLLRDDCREQRNA